MIPTFLPPLEYMAIVRIALSIYNESDIQDMLRFFQRVRVAQPYYNIVNYFWNQVKEVALRKLQKDLPRLLRARVANMLRAISMEYEEWLKDHKFLSEEASVFYMINDDPMVNRCVIHWNPEGTINRLQTAVNIIGNRNLDPRIRFLMACMYFRVNEIPPLWRIVATLEFYEYTNTNFVVQFWKDCMRRSDEVTWKQMFDEHFQHPSLVNNDVPYYRVSAFFHDLSRESRIEYFSILGTLLVHSDDLRCCMYQMDREELVELYRSKPQRILCTFLKWPLVTLFMEMANQLWEYLSPQGFVPVLQYIMSKYLLSDLKHFDYLELFREFWDASPVHLKEQVYGSHYYDMVQRYLIQNENTILYNRRRLVSVQT